MNYTDYYLERDDGGAPLGLGRVIEYAAGLRGGTYRNGRWQPDESVIRLAMDPRWAEPVSAAEAVYFMASLDG